MSDPINDLENLVSQRLIALLHASDALEGIQKIHPESPVKIRTPLIAVQAEVAGPAPGFEGSGMAAGVFAVAAMLTVTVHRSDAQDGLLLRLTGIVRDILLAELRGEETDPLATLNHTFADGRILKVWHMELEPMARSNDSERGFDHRNFNLRLYAAVIEPEGE